MWKYQSPPTMHTIFLYLKRASEPDACLHCFRHEAPLSRKRFIRSRPGSPSGPCLSPSIDLLSIWITSIGLLPAFAYTETSGRTWNGIILSFDRLPTRVSTKPWMPTRVARVPFPFSAGATETSKGSSESAARARDRGLASQSYRNKRVEKIKIVWDDRPYSNFRIIHKQPIQSTLHFVNTLGYPSQCESICEFSGDYPHVSETPNHFFYYREGGLRELLNDTFRNVKWGDLVKTDLINFLKEMAFPSSRYSRHPVRTRVTLKSKFCAVQSAFRLLPLSLQGRKLFSIITIVVAAASAQGLLKHDSRSKPILLFTK